MGNQSSIPFFMRLTYWFGPYEKRILMLGLDNAGKTTIVYTLKLSQPVVVTMPTIGFNVETIEFTPSLNMVIWDIGGQDKLKSLWYHYYEDSAALIFVIDSADTARFGIVREEIQKLNCESKLKDIPFLFVCNKQDMPNAKKTTEISKELGIVEMMQFTDAEAALPENQGRVLRRPYHMIGTIGSQVKISQFHWLVAQLDH